MSGPSSELRGDAVAQLPRGEVSLAVYDAAENFMERPTRVQRQPVRGTA